MTTWVCPEVILELFNAQHTKAAGRKATIEWLKAVVPQLRPGDTVMLPDADTGELTPWEPERFTRH